MGFSLQLWHKFRHQFDGSGGGESVHLRCRGWGLLAVLQHVSIRLPLLSRLFLLCLTAKDDSDKEQIP